VNLGRSGDADEKDPNGKNGKSVGLVDRIKTGVKEDLESLRATSGKSQEQVELLKKPSKTQVFTSIFRHKHDDTPRNRALGVLSNVFCIFIRPRSIVTRCVTAIPGEWAHHLLFVHCADADRRAAMFYYHPSKVQAFRDVLYLEHDVPFGKLLRNMHRWAAH